MTLEELIRQGRRLLDAHESVHAHRAFLEWDEDVAEWLDERYPGSGASASWTSQPMSTLASGAGYSDDSLSWGFFQTAIQSRMRWLARFAAAPSEKEAAEQARPALVVPSTRLFLVHGRAEGTRETVARFLEKLGLEVVILHEQPNKGRSLIQKFTDYADVAFAVVILTGDDIARIMQCAVRKAPFLSG